MNIKVTIHLKDTTRTIVGTMVDTTLETEAKRFAGGMNSTTMDISGGGKLQIIPIANVSLIELEEVNS